MNRANAILLVLAGAAAPGAVATFHLPDMAQLAAYAFVLALVAIVALRGTQTATAAPQLPERYESVPTERLAPVEAYTGQTERLED